VGGGRRREDGGGGRGVSARMRVVVAFSLEFSSVYRGVA
jgi:hypothetical protein